MNYCRHHAREILTCNRRPACRYSSVCILISPVVHLIASFMSLALEVHVNSRHARKHCLTGPFADRLLGQTRIQNSKGPWDTSQQIARSEIHLSTNITPPFSSHNTRTIIFYFIHGEMDLDPSIPRPQPKSITNSWLGIIGQESWHMQPDLQMLHKTSHWLP